MENDHNKTADESPSEQHFLETISLLQGAVKADGTINGRSTWGRSIAAVKEALQADQYQSAKALLEHQVATLSVIEKVIEQYVLQNVDRFFVDGELNPLIANNLVRFQGHTRQALTMLIELNRRKQLGLLGKKGKGRDLSELSFD